MMTLFRRCLLANYAIVPEALRAPLCPDVGGGRPWVSVVIADMWRMRSAGLPAVLGVSYS